MKNLIRIIPALLLAAVSLNAKADTLTLNSIPSNTVIGPYALTLNSTPVLLFCLNDLNQVILGESWGVTIYNGAFFVGSAPGSNGFKYEEEAYIYNQLNGSNNQDVQDALWTIFDPTTTQTDANSPALVAAAANFNGYTASYLSSSTFYIYNGGPVTNQYQNYLPQNFIGSASPVPEPSSFLLLGTGLASLAGLVRRKLGR